MAAVSSGNVARKTLADISNLPVQQLVLDGKPRSSITTKDYEQLLKEKMQLTKILADRQKIIEVTGIELQKLRINQQKMQEQNKLLAQSNRQLLAEMNANSEKVKALNHDLGCKNGLLKALQHELKSQVKVNVFEEEIKLTGTEDLELAARGPDADKQETSSRIIHLKRLGPSRQVQSKEKAANKRACVRRQSARFKSEEAKSSEDSCEIPETKLIVCPPPTDSDLGDGVASTVIIAKDEDKEANAAFNFCMNEEEVELTGIEDCELAERGQDVDKQDSFNRTIHSKSLDPSHQCMSKEDAGNKRACVRRQSARFKSKEVKSSEDLCEILETTLNICPPPTDSDLEDGVASKVTAVKDEDKEGNVAISSCVNEEEVKLAEIEVPGGLATKGQDADKQGTFNRRNQSKSLGLSRQVLSKEKAGNKRACTRRQINCARFKSAEAESSEEFCEIPETKLIVRPPPTETNLEDGVASTMSIVKDEHKERNDAIDFCMNEEEVKLTETEVVGELASKGQDFDKQGTFNMRNRSKSLRPSRHVLSNENAGNKRACVSRQSARFKSKEAESTDELCEIRIPETKVAVRPPPTDSVLESSVVSTAEKDEDKERIAAVSHEQRRPGRPSRVAATKVQSYKEIPLKVKMRRPD